MPLNESFLLKTGASSIEFYIRWCVTKFTTLMLMLRNLTYFDNGKGGIKSIWNIVDYPSHPVADLCVDLEHSETCVLFV